MTAAEDGVRPGWKRSFLVEQEAPTGSKSGHFFGRFGECYEYKEGYEVWFPGAKKPLSLINLEAKGIRRC